MKCSGFSKENRTASHPYSRRDFLRSMSAATAALLVGGVANRQLFGSPMAGNSLVATATATSYDRALIRQLMENMFSNLGGLGDLIKSGDSVAIKINLTGGQGSASSS